MAVKKYWRHARHGKRKFVGIYDEGRGGRYFRLISLGDGVKKDISFESSAMAKKLGWVRR